MFPQKTPQSSIRLGVTRIIFICLFTIGLNAKIIAETTVGYGKNNTAGKYFVVNNVKIYCEIYGSGPPLVLIHGGGGSISVMENQIKHFSSKYKVIVVDSRGHGNSELGTQRLTYEQMAEDYNELLNQLKTTKAYIFGWSDGGIIGLILAIKHPDKVEKLAILGANLIPSGIYGWTLEWVVKELKIAEEQLKNGDKSQPWSRIIQQYKLPLEQPNISIEQLKTIQSPTLVIAGDRDLVRIEHTISIFESIKHSQLCILPGATHFVPVQNSEQINAVISTFFEKPFSQPDTKENFK